MVGKIHPVGMWTPDLPHLPLEELVWIAWNRFHEDHTRDCMVCRNIADWCLDLIWSSWDHETYIFYKDFTHRLINTNKYDWYMNKVASCDMHMLKAFFYGSKPYYFFPF